MAAYKIAVNTAKRLIPSKLWCPSNRYPIICDISKGNVSTNKLIIPHRCSSYRSSPMVGPVDQYTGFEISKSPEEWIFVERLLPPKVVPEPKVKAEYSSGWKPQTEESLKLPYFVERTKNHMLAVYLKISFRGQRKITQVKKIQGDIWDQPSRVEFLCGFSLLIPRKMLGWDLITRSHRSHQLLSFASALEKELKEYLQQKRGKRIGSQVHELCGHIYFKGDHVIHCQEWLLSKGL